MRRPGEPARCGWCMSGYCQPGDATRGCVQHQRNSKPCPCPDPSHTTP